MVPNILTSNKQTAEPETLSPDALESQKFMQVQDVLLGFQSKVTSLSPDSIVVYRDTFDSDVLRIG